MTPHVYPSPVPMRTTKWNEMTKSEKSTQCRSCVCTYIQLGKDKSEDAIDLPFKMSRRRCCCCRQQKVKFMCQQPHSHKHGH